MSNTPEDTELGIHIDYRTLYSEKELRTIADRIANTINDLELDQEWDDEETVMLAFGEFMNSKYFKALITLHTQEAVAEAIGEDEPAAGAIYKSRIYAGTDQEFAEEVRLNEVAKGRNELRAEQRAKAHLTDPTERSE